MAVKKGSIDLHQTIIEAEVHIAGFKDYGVEIRVTNLVKEPQREVGFFVQDKMVYVVADRRDYPENLRRNYRQLVDSIKDYLLRNNTSQKV